MLAPSNVSVNQQEQEADTEKWVAGAVTQSPLSVTGAENDKLASVALHGYNNARENTPLSRGALEGGGRMGWKYSYYHWTNPS